MNKHLALKKGYVVANHVSYMTKTLRKAIVNRSKLETKYSNLTTQLWRKELNVKKQKIVVARFVIRRRKSFIQI